MLMFTLCRIIMKIIIILVPEGKIKSISAISIGSFRYFGCSKTSFVLKYSHFLYLGLINKSKYAISLIIARLGCCVKKH